MAHLGFQVGYFVLQICHLISILTDTGYFALGNKLLVLD